MNEPTNQPDNTLKHSSDILFLMDATLTNPNGDPYENIPRHYRTEQGNIGEITGVCLGQTIRSYLKGINGAGNTPCRVFVDRDGDVLSAGEALARFAETEEELKGSPEDKRTEWLMNKFLNAFLDVRLFGSLVTVQEQAEQRLKTLKITLKKNSIQLTGPVQLGALGKSVHPIVLQKVPITSAFRSGEEKDDQKGDKKAAEVGTRGEKWVVNYGLYQFTPVIDATLAAKTRMTKRDKDLFTEALWCGIKARVSGSKANQLPLLYLEVVYREGVKGRIGRLSDFVSYTLPREPQSIRDVIPNVDNLVTALVKHKGYVEKILVIADQDRLTLGLAAKLKEQGFSVEEGCSVTGKFGIPLESAASSPGT
jgi:CRISPR-associated protein Csh2